MSGMTTTATGHSYVDVESGARLDVWYPGEGVSPARTCLAEDLGLIRGEVITTTIEDLQSPPADAADAYLRLHMLSRREAVPHGISVEGIFGKLNNVAWTTAGPVVPDKVDTLRSLAAETVSYTHLTLPTTSRV